MTQAGRTPVLHRIGQAPRRDFGPRQPLTTTHHHGQLLRRSDGRLGLVRISKNASSELVDRLANRFAQELRKHEPGPGLVRRIRRLYASDETVWEQLRASGGDHPLSDLLAA
ncbi:MAG: hypothetical protein KatS3mg118_3412 [Paracoccaceae bacterium]|nr:MAG: hypothetical protein KatS3mg118_3412 [Paracoccaceae bacterium]